MEREGKDMGQNCLGELRALRFVLQWEPGSPWPPSVEDRTIFSTMRGSGERLHTLVPPALSVG